MMTWGWGGVGMTDSCKACRVQEGRREESPVPRTRSHAALDVTGSPSLQDEKLG